MKQLYISCIRELDNERKKGREIKKIMVNVETSAAFVVFFREL